MSGPGRRFDPAELGTPVAADEAPITDAELAEALAVARELESLSAGDSILPSNGFEDRVMAAIAAEPAPRLAVRPASAVRGGRIGAFLLAVRDSWGVATGGGRPAGVRAQALAFVLLVVVAAGALTAVTAVTVGSLVQRSSPPPAPSLVAPPTTAPAPTQPATPPTSPAPSETAEPSETPEATESAEPGDAGAAGATAKPREVPRATRTPRPTETPELEDTHSPEDTPEPTGTDDHGGNGGSGSSGSGETVTDGSGRG